MSTETEALADTIELHSFLFSKRALDIDIPDTEGTQLAQESEKGEKGESSKCGEGQRFHAVEKAAVDCIIRMGGHASFSIICEHVSNVLALQHRRDLPASRHYYAAIQACLLNAPDVFVQEGRDRWGVSRSVRKRGEELARAKAKARHVGHNCRLTNRLVMGLSPLFQLSDLCDDDANSCDDQSGASDYTPASVTAAHRSGDKKSSKKKTLSQKAIRKKGGQTAAAQTTTATDNSGSASTKQETLPPHQKQQQQPPPLSLSSDNCDKAGDEGPADSRKITKSAGYESDVKKEKETSSKKTRTPTPGLPVSAPGQETKRVQRTAAAAAAVSADECEAVGTGRSDSAEGPARGRVKREEAEGANRQSQCAFCGKQIQVAKRYVFYTAENGKDVDYIGGKRNALGKRKYPDSGHVCNDCYKSNGAALRKEERSEEPEAKKRKPKVVKEEDDDDEEEEEDSDEENKSVKDSKGSTTSLTTTATSPFSANVKVEDEKDELDTVKDDENDGLMDISLRVDEDDMKGSSGSEQDSPKVLCASSLIDDDEYEDVAVAAAAATASATASVEGENDDDNNNYGDSSSNSSTSSAGGDAGEEEEEEEEEESETKSDSREAKETTKRKGSSAPLQVLQIQYLIASMMHSKAKEREGAEEKEEEEKEDERGGVTEEEIRSYIVQVLDSFHWSITQRGIQTHKKRFSYQDLPSLIKRALGVTDSYFSFAKNGRLWSLAPRRKGSAGLKGTKKLTKKQQHK